MNLFYIFIVLITFTPCNFVSADSSCSSEWFGEYCQYKCHCKNKTCKSDGSCGSNSCESGWFGYKCQYKNLIKKDIEWLTDENDTTCNTNKSIKTFSSRYFDNSVFTWLRLIFKENEPIRYFSIQFHTSNNTDVPCLDQNLTLVDNKTLDVWCSLNVTVQQINITGEGVSTLCSLYVSGGRNVALKQPTNQSTTFVEDIVNSQSFNAVDGNTNSAFSSGSCTHTGKGDKSPTWTVRFNETFIVNKCVLYNRNASDDPSANLPDRLKHFSLWIFGDNSSVLMNYTDQDTTSKQIYTVNSLNGKNAVQVSIAAQRNSNDLFLTLCEVEIYGDCPEGKKGLECNETFDKENDMVCFGYDDPPMCIINCPAGTWGLNCVNNCTDHCWNSNCSRDNGFCLSGCNGFNNPPECSESCPDYTWGKNCNMTCSSQCLNSSCDRLTGKCLYGCLPGFENFNCSKECDAGNWGLNCRNACRVECYNNNCSKITGGCLQDCNGSNNPPDCNVPCPTDHWGFNCISNCSSNCKNLTCDRFTGHCTLGCLPGFNGQNCTTACEPGTWGHNCAHICNTGCKGNSCHNVNGDCLEGCDGFSDPPNCTLALQKKTDDSVNIGYIVGPIVAALLLACFIIMGIIFWRRHRGLKRNKDTNLDGHQGFQHSMVTLVANEEKDIKVIESAKDQGYYNIVDIIDDTSISVNDFNQFMMTHKSAFFNDQFKKIPTPVDLSTKFANTEGNKNKNRYKNICTYDHSRVNLKINTGKNEGDYINASYIKGFNGKDEYIASQGPNATILNDFVRMLWEQNVEKVVMLTNLIEEGKMKCERYWPEEEKSYFGDIKMRLVTTTTFPDYTVRKMELMKKGEDTHHLVHYQFHGWPDKGVPVSTWSLVDFEKKVSAQHTRGLTVVHCSAGVGRTGTFIALLNILAQARETGKMNFFQTVAKLRKDRVFMVQSPAQYEFLHRVTQASLICLYRSEENMREDNGIGKEFSNVCTVCDVVNQEQKIEEDDGENVYQNTQKISLQDKNRFSNISASVRFRPFLNTANDITDGYINAVIVQGLKQRDQYFLSQLPMLKTVDDFWRLVTQYKINVVVSFEHGEIKTDKSIVKYLPTQSEKDFETPLFKLLTDTQHSKSTLLWDEQRLTVTCKDETYSEKHNVIILQASFKDLTAKKWLEFVRHVKKCYSPSGKVVYICKNGAQFSGLACALSLVLERMDSEMKVNIPLVVGSLKLVRPEVLATVDQYRLIYEVLNLCNENSNQYTSVGDRSLKEIL